MEKPRKELKHWGKKVSIGFVLLACFVCIWWRQKEKYETEQLKEQWEEAQTTPLGKYPELVTYRLAKLTVDDYVGGDANTTYEDNAYTQYLRRILNIQNINVFETSHLKDYVKRLEILSESSQGLPDVMHITDKNLLDYFVEEDLLEDLTQAYEDCTSDVIKEMYASYGEDFLEEYTYDGKLMGIPSAEVDQGASLLWLRKDWMDELGLEDPETPEEAWEIIRTFAHENPGDSPTGNVGLGFTISDGNSQVPSFSILPVFSLFYAYPGAWLPDEDGNLTYGSVGQNVKKGLENIRELYASGALDKSFMLRTPSNILELINSGACGAVFGPWSLPYGYLQQSKIAQGAEWQPYLLCNEDGYVTAPYSYNTISCIAVRKGYEYPEVVPKILTAIYDYARYEGVEDAVEINDSNRTHLPGRWEAMPLAIDVNYKDNLRQTAIQIREVLNGETDCEDVPAYTQKIAEQCSAYLEGQDEGAFGWAAYTARVCAIEEICKREIRYVNEGYPQARSVSIPGELVTMEKEAFIKIITGEEDLDSFDDFGEKWYQSGGRELIEEVNGTQ